MSTNNNCSRGFFKLVAILLLLSSCFFTACAQQSSASVSESSITSSEIAKEYTVQLEKTIASMKLLLSNFEKKIDELVLNNETLSKDLANLEKRVVELESKVSK